MILGHPALSYVFYKKLRFPRSAPWWVILIGSYLPDFLDKTLNLLWGLPGRGYFHSVVVDTGIFLVALAHGKFFRSSKETVQGIWGLWTFSVLHCVGDLPDIFDLNMFFWPLLNWEHRDLGTFSVAESYRRVYGDVELPMTLFCELFFLGYAFYLLAKGVSRTVISPHARGQD